MDWEELEKAVLSEEVSFLEEKLVECNSNDDYSYILKSQENKGNILHLGAGKNSKKFFKEAINLIPSKVVEKLLCHKEGNYKNQVFNPLHVAAYNGHVEIVKLIVEFYNTKVQEKNLLPRGSKPWLAKDKNGRTPLHVALEEKKEDCALEILSIEMETLCNSVDNFKNSPLFLAVKHGYNDVAKEILNSNLSYSVSGKDGYTALHFMPNCSGEVCRLLVEKNKKEIKNSSDGGQTILHQWAELGKIEIFESLVTTEGIGDEIINNLVDLISKRDREDNNPFHIVVQKENKEASKMLAKFYRKYKPATATATATATAGLESEPLLPWLACNTSSKTPMDLALKDDSEVLKWLESTFKDKKRYRKDEPVFLAVKNQKTEVAQQIWDAYIEYGWRPLCPGGKNIWKAALDHSKKVAKWVGDNLPEMIEKEEVKQALLEASEKGYDWLVTPMLNKHPMALEALEENPEFWIKACEEGHLSTLLAFINNCPNFRELCLKTKTTPLHHIKLKGYEQNRKLVENPVMKGLRNYQDEQGETPLYKAIKDKKIELTEVLLTTDDVSRSLKDPKAKTPMALLNDQCNEDSTWTWNDMCKRNGIIPGLKTQYFQDKANIYEVRNTLSVVAALLATITFTAEFTVPGGFNNDTGQALLGDKAAFIVFIVADAFAMFCSMVMLVCLMWSMVCDHAKSLMLIDRSMPILLGALVSTIVAFITGVYTVLRSKCLWVAIVIIVMCSLFILTVFKNFVIWLLEIFSPVTKRKIKDLEKGPTPSIQEDNQGETTTTPEDEEQTTTAPEDGRSWIHRKVFNCFRGRCPQPRKSE